MNNSNVDTKSMMKKPKRYRNAKNLAATTIYLSEGEAKSETIRGKPGKFVGSQILLSSAA
jgi:hypothetical protein